MGMNENLTKEDVEDLNELLRSLRVEIATLKDKVEEMESSRSGTESVAPAIPQQLTEDRGEAVYHTVKQIQANRDQREFLKRERAEELLSLAADAAIADYKANPPKHRA